MDLADAKMASAWQRAAEDLGIGVELLRSTGGPPGDGAPFAIHIKDFGGPNGTICWYYDEGRDRHDLLDWAQANGFYYSILFDPYFDYDRDFFADTLNDWGWFGNDSPPPWYAGRAWEPRE